MSRIAFVGIDRHIHLVSTDGSGLTQLTSPIGAGTGAWGLGRKAQEAWSWPTWSHDASWIAAFSVEPGDQQTGPARVRALSVDGIRELEWAELQGSAPVYLQWHRSGDALMVLLQQGEELAMGVLRREHLGRMRTIEHGVPLFFNWAPDGSRLACHIGAPRGGPGRLLLRDPLGVAEDILFDEAGGSFCAPVWCGDLLAYAIRPDGDPLSTVVVSNPDGTGRRALLARRGLLALVAAPDGLPFLAVSHAPRGEGTPYRGIERVDLDTGEVCRVVEDDLLAFFWAPGGEWLLTVQVDKQENCLRCHRVDAETGASTFLVTFWPTRDLLFFLHFFEQYASSHSLLSPDGRYLVYAGYPAGGGQADLSSPPRIYVKDTLHPDVPVTEVGRGSFAVYAPVA